MAEISSPGEHGMLIANAFSLNMLDAGSLPCAIHVREVDREEACSLAAGAQSVVGHSATAAIFCDVLGIPVATNRATVTLRKGDELLVGQYIGPRLEEGATTLPPGATIKWLLVRMG